MATAEQYAQWLVANQDKKGTPDFELLFEDNAKGMKTGPEGGQEGFQI